jgi:hypothetical protein
MSNKKNEDIEMRPGDAGDFGGEKDPFLGKNSPGGRPRREASLSSYFDKLDHSPGASILAYCLASISMTVVNKYVVSGSSWNLNFFYLAIQVRIFCGAEWGRRTQERWLTVASRLFAHSRFSFRSRLASSRTSRLSILPRPRDVRWQQTRWLTQDRPADIGR